MPDTYPYLYPCTLGVFSALAFTADFPPAALKFYQRTHRLRLKNLQTFPCPDQPCSKIRKQNGTISDAALLFVILICMLFQTRSSACAISLICRRISGSASAFFSPSAVCCTVGTNRQSCSCVENSVFSQIQASAYRPYR